MWKALTTKRTTSDPDFVAWRVTAENDDGRIRTVVVKIEASVVDGSSWTTGKGALRHVRDAMETRETSLVDSRRYRETSCRRRSSSDTELEVSLRSSLPARCQNLGGESSHFRGDSLMGCAEPSAPGDDSAGSASWHIRDDGLARTVLVIRPRWLLLPALQVLRQPRREPSSHPPKLGPGSLVIRDDTPRLIRSDS